MNITIDNLADIWYVHGKKTVCKRCKLCKIDCGTLERRYGGPMESVHGLEAWIRHYNEIHPFEYSVMTHR